MKDFIISVLGNDFYVCNQFSSAYLFNRKVSYEHREIYCVNTHDGYVDLTQYLNGNHTFNIIESENITKVVKKAMKESETMQKKVEALRKEYSETKKSFDAYTLRNLFKQETIY